MYQIPKLVKIPGLFHAFSEKNNGNMANVILGKSCDFNQVLKNREKFLKKLQINIDSCICIWVLGKDGIKVADPKNAGISMKDYRKAVKIDALITDKKGLYLFLLTADCAPIILFDPVKKVLGLVHVGWKGADLGIVKKVIKKLKDLYRIDPKNLIIGIGPAARKESFVKEDPSQKSDLMWKDFLKPINSTYYRVDFVGFTNKQLVDAGVKRENIYDCGIDTVFDNRFFSHVREGKLPQDMQGRFACIVGIK